MGATSITTLAEAVLILTASRQRFLEEILPFLKGAALLSWATGTWRSPLLLPLEVWHHIDRRFPVGYDPECRGIVFPLGMYATCTFELEKATGSPFLLSVPQVVTYTSLAAWIITFVGPLYRLWASLIISPVSRAEAS